MKKKLIISAMVLTLICTGCGNSKSDNMAQDSYNDYGYTNSVAGEQGGFDDTYSYEEKADDYVSMETTEAEMAK